MKTVIISGALANKPLNGGNAWSRLGWILGMRRLGFDVCFVEEISRESCVDANSAVTDFQRSLNLEFFCQIMDQFGLSNSSALVYAEGEQTYGLSMKELRTRAQEACLLVNLSGHLTHPELKDSISCKVYYDDDPGFTQFWDALDNSAPRLQGHDFHFTIGENIGKPECPVPLGNIHWRYTRPPVVLQQWPDAKDYNCQSFTTVASWRGAYGTVQHNGQTYGPKAHQFRKFMTLPQRAGGEFEIALHIHEADHKDKDSLETHGWRLSQPEQVAHSPEAYRRYVQNSAAEFSVAQGVYVDTQCGWVSDRTARYLASGRPALVQDTGFSRNYPTGQGLLAFRTLDEAEEGVHRIRTDYARHAQAARRIAEEYFDSDKVLLQLLSEVGLSPARGPATQ